MSTGPVPLHVMLRASEGWFSTSRTQSMSTTPPAGSLSGAGSSRSERFVPVPRLVAVEDGERRQIDEVDAPTRPSCCARPSVGEPIEHGVRAPVEQHVGARRHAHPERAIRYLLALIGYVEPNFPTPDAAEKRRLEQPDVGVGDHGPREHPVGESRLRKSLPAENRRC